MPALLCVLAALGTRFVKNDQTRFAQEKAARPNEAGLTDAERVDTLCRPACKWPDLQHGLARMRSRLSGSRDRHAKLVIPNATAPMDSNIEEKLHCQSGPFNQRRMCAQRSASGALLVTASLFRWAPGVCPLQRAVGRADSREGPLRTRWIP